MFDIHGKLQGEIMEATQPVFIGEIARRAGMTVKTVRFYEKIGLIPPAARNAGNLRLFPPGLFPRLKFIKRAKTLGFRLDDIKEILSAYDQGLGSCSHVARRVNCLLEGIEEKLSELIAQKTKLLGLKKRLAQTRGSRSSVICPVIDDARPISS